MDWLSRTAFELFENIPEGILSYHVAQRLKIKVRLSYIEPENDKTATVFKLETNDEFVQYNAFYDFELINQLLIKYILNKNSNPVFIQTKEDLIRWLLIIFIIE